MSVDPTTMAIITAVGGTGVTVGGALLKYVRLLHTSTVKQLQTQNDKLERRTAECEEDRKTLHGRLNDQSEKITAISQQLGRLEGRLSKD
jgi:septal ring factor EnvC (AmiA/AmiB activator)